MNRAVIILIILSLFTCKLYNPFREADYDLETIKTVINPPTPTPTPTPTPGYFYDSFTNISFSNDEGSLSWSGPWSELGESDGAATGHVFSNGTYLRILGDYSNYIDPVAIGLERAMNMSGYSTAELSFDYRRVNYYGENRDTSPLDFKVEISIDGGSNWNLVYSMPNGNDGSKYCITGVSITDYISASTLIRFSNGGAAVMTGEMRLNNIRIDMGQPQA